MPIDLVVNPNARMYQRDGSLLDRMEAVSHGRCDLHVTESVDELTHLCQRLAERGSDLVLLSGGDGSLMAGVTALSDAFGDQGIPPLAPIPGGTAGTVARNWGFFGDPPECLDRLLSRPRRLTLRPSLRVEAWDGAGNLERRQVGFIVGTGLVAQFFGLYYERKAPGYVGAARIVARIFLESFYGGPVARRILEPLPCSLALEGVALEPAAWSLVCCAVVPNLGIHMLVTHRAAEDHERPHLVATPLQPRQLGPRAPRVLAGKPIGGRDNVDRLVRDFTIRFPNRGPYVLDGELLEASRVEVTAGPRLTIMTPA
jgi:diacylglycerol kinase (ATP)